MQAPTETQALQTTGAQEAVSLIDEWLRSLEGRELYSVDQVRDMLLDLRLAVTTTGGTDAE